MYIIKRVGIAFIVLFIVLLSSSGCLKNIEENSKDNNTHSHESKTLYVANTPDADYHNIQDAIDAASNGTTIIVNNGTYYETLTITYSINLIGAGTNTTFIDYAKIISNTQITGILINADNCTIQGFTLTKRSGTANVIGITISTSHNNISHMTISNLSEGLYLKKKL